MRFALLGADAEMLPLARAVHASRVHTLVWAAELGDYAEEIAASVPRLQVAEEWEALLTGKAADAVMVARGDDDRRADQLRKLIQAGVPLIVAHPVHDSMLVYYELDMIRQDSGSILIPNLSDRDHPAAARLKSWLEQPDASPVGQIEQVVCERAILTRSRRTVLASFVRDVDLLRYLCGELNQVGAMTSAAERDEWANLSVQMSGPAGVLVRWSVGPVESVESVRISLVGTHGKTTLEVPDGRSSWSLSARPGAEQPAEGFPVWDAPVAVLDRFSRAVAGETVSPNWTDACRELELADAIDHSLQRGRKIELHFDEHTEHGTFKGLMSGIGCAVLIGGLLLTILAAVAGGLGLPVGDSWAYILLAVFGVFLLLQALKLVFPEGG